jgi:dipeptidyl aminopeptidase/acylaminoacyl peptidase
VSARAPAPETAPPRFTQLTFRRGIVMSARFSPDGHTVVYSALWDGRPPEVFSRRLESPGSVSLGLPPATLLSVSARGELAVLVAPPRETGTVWLGTLARVPLSGGPLRPVLETVLDADWSPDGRELAAIRWHDGQFQLEYPLGTVLRRPCPATKVRVSPRGDQVALLDDRGGILVVGHDGSSRALEVPPAHQRLVWSPDGKSLLVDAGDVDLRRTLRRVSLGGEVTEVCALAGTRRRRLRLHSRVVPAGPVRRGGIAVDNPRSRQRQRDAQRLIESAKSRRLKTGDVARQRGFRQADMSA